MRPHWPRSRDCVLPSDDSEVVQDEQAAARAPAVGRSAQEHVRWHSRASRKSSGGTGAVPRLGSIGEGLAYDVFD